MFNFGKEEFSTFIKNILVIFEKNFDEELKIITRFEDSQFRDL